MPTQMPRNGRPGRRSRSIASRMPSTAASPAAQSANAPWPGSTTRSAAATCAGSAVTVTSAAIPACSAARASARAAEVRLPLP